MPSAVEDKSKKPVFINKPLDWSTTFNLSQAVRSIRFVEDGEGNLWGFPVVMVDPAGNSPIEARAAVVIRDATTPGSTANVITPAVYDLAAASFRALETYSAQVVYKPSTPGWEAQRTPDTFKTLFNQTAGGNVLWDPAVGARVRLMGGIFTIAAPTLGAAAVNRVGLYDSAVQVIYLEFWCAAAAAATNIVLPFNFPGNGYLCPLNGDLSMTLATNLTAGSISVTVWGTEE